MAQQQQIDYPELFIGLAGPVGIDAESLLDEVSKALTDVGYKPFPIHITKEMAKFSPSSSDNGPLQFHDAMFQKMDRANEICRGFSDPAALMRIAINAIKKVRFSELNQPIEFISEEEIAIPKAAYVIRQLKRPEEVHLLRRIYGKQFILISAYASKNDRRLVLKKKIKDTLPVSTEDTTAYHFADKLIDRDENEGSEVFGQHLRDTFHLADLFVDGINLSNMRSGISRFFQAFFGRVDIGPTRAEYGMYAASSAALRSCDLSRQIGAAIFSPDGEMIVQGCNEVPKAGGGTYWDGDDLDNRDVKIGFDPNDFNKQNVLRDLIERLATSGALSDSISNENMTTKDIILKLTGKSKETSDKYFGCLNDALLNDLTEYGRVVHAEMSALCDAARLGRSVKHSILYSTTFPCHNCTKHIIASGIKKVFFIEPYPKSKAKELHENEIELDRDSNTRVAYLPFLGISPVRYRDIFFKGSRKNSGKAKIWYTDEPRPLLNVSGPAYLDTESWEIVQLQDQDDASKSAYAS